MNEIKMPVSLSFKGKLEIIDADGNVLSTGELYRHINAAAAREAKLRQTMASIHRRAVEQYDGAFDDIAEAAQFALRALDGDDANE